MLKFLAAISIATLASFPTRVLLSMIAEILMASYLVFAALLWKVTMIIRRSTVRLVRVIYFSLEAILQVDSKNSTQLIFYYIEKEYRTKLGKEIIN